MTGRGKHPTDETRRKMSEVRKGKPKTEEWKRKIGEAHIGIPRPEWLKRRISEFEKTRVGDRNSNWRGGRLEWRDDGYIIVYSPEHPYHDRDGYVMEHRLKMEEKLGRYLTEEEVVHHINNIPYDNRIENLLLFPNQSEHMKHHGLLKIMRRLVIPDLKEY